MEVHKQTGLFEPPKQLSLFGDPKRKVILEGGFQDDWSRISSVHPLEMEIGDDVSRINVRYQHGGSPSRLVLVYRWVGTELIATDPLKERVVEQNINRYGVMQSVTSLIIEDGRVYFDIKYYQDSLEHNRERLHRFKSRLAEKTDDTNPVDLFFSEKGRERFRGSAIEIYDTIPS